MAVVKPCILALSLSTQSAKCHDGNKISRVVFCGSTNFVVTTGFSRSNDRQLALWNPVSVYTSLASGGYWSLSSERVGSVYVLGASQ